LGMDSGENWLMNLSIDPAGRSVAAMTQHHLG